MLDIKQMTYILDKLNKMNIDNKAFTLAELVVTITIIAILSTLGFVSYSYMISDSRNTQIQSEMSQLSKLFEL